MIQINAEPVSPQQVLANLKTSNAESVVIHLGVVRRVSEGKKVRNSANGPEGWDGQGRGFPFP